MQESGKIKTKKITNFVLKSTYFDQESFVE